MKKLIFSGYYGQSNMGDDAFGIVAVWGAKKYWNSKASLLSSKGPINKKITINYELPKKQYFRGEFLFRTIKKLLISDMCILAGGSVLHTQHKMLTINGLIFLFAKIGLCKVGAIGVSIGPFKTEEDYIYIKKQLTKFKFLVLRDKKSYDIAVSMELPYKPILASDLAFLLPELHLSEKLQKSKNKILGISLCHYERYTDGNIKNEVRRESLILEVLQEVIKTLNVKLRFFIINGHNSLGDEEFIMKTIAKLSLSKKEYEVINYSPNTLSMLDKIVECDTVFTTRLHGAIFAAAMNIPSLLVEYHEKCSDYLDDIGLEDDWRIGDMEIPPLLIKEKILVLLEKKQQCFYPNREHLMVRSKNNFLKVEV